MTTWTEGYVADITYTHGYYGELHPARARAVLLEAGIAVPEFGTACELGFGQGLSVNVHAAGSNTAWYGTDFNPAQAAHAKGLAGIAGAGATLFDDAFAEFAVRPDLPDFDFIGIHGIWSWISDENRAVIVDFVRRKLKTGGVLYISYNTLPGWAPFMPMRHLLTQHAATQCAPGDGIVPRIDASIAFVERLLETNPVYGRANPGVGERLKKLKEQNRHYLAHEYFNRDWLPMHFSTMAEWLEPAKVQFACSAHPLDHLPALHFTPDQQKLLAEIKDTNYREQVRDFLVNQQFRRDYWVKGVRRLSAQERMELLRQQRVMLVTHRPDVKLKANGTLGEASLNADIYDPLLDVLADHKVHSLAALEAAVAGRNLSVAQILQAVFVLMGMGSLAPVQEGPAIEAATANARRLNAHLCRQSRYGNEMEFMASPVTGGGLPVGRFQQLFLLAIAEGRTEPSEWAAFAWSVLQAQGLRLIKEGKPLETPELNLAEFTEQAQNFAQKQLPVLRAAQVA